MTYFIRTEVNQVGYYLTSKPRRNSWTWSLSI